MRKASVGIIGCGNISTAYLKAAQRFDNLQVTACADLDLARAKSKAAEFEIPTACSPEHLVRRDDVDIVLNLTIPAAHADVALAALDAGKHVYGEKPLACSLADGRKIMALAANKQLRVGCAPDTFLGGGLQTCRKLIDDGWIGQPIAACAFMTNHGVESWHPSPDFYYQPGGGPMMDMGPYYLAALVSILGPARRVCGSARITFPERIITSQAHYSRVIPVTTPTHVAGTIDFACGAIVSVLMSFDVWAADLPWIEIYGTSGSLKTPDPNTFGGVVQVRRAGATTWSPVPLTHGYVDNWRGLGLADMAAALASGRPHRASGELALHVLEAMNAFLESSADERYITLQSAVKRPAPLPMNLRDGQIDP